MPSRLTEQNLSFTPALHEALLDFADYSDLKLSELLRMHHTEQQAIVDDIEIQTLPRIQVAARTVFGNILKGKKSEHVVVRLERAAVEHYDYHGDRLDLTGNYLGRWAILNGVALEMLDENFTVASTGELSTMALSNT